MQAEESTFEQEPGSGAKAIIEGKLVSVGTLEWLQRYVTVAFPLRTVLKPEICYLPIESTILSYCLLSQFEPRKVECQLIG